MPLVCPTNCSAPSGATPSAPQSIVYGNQTGYQTEFVIPDSAIATRVALLNIVGARLAVVRGLAQESVWPTAVTQFETLVQTLNFTLPAGLTNPFDALPDDDGGSGNINRANCRVKHH